MKLIFDFKMNNLPTELMNLFKFNHNVTETRYEVPHYTCFFIWS